MSGRRTVETPAAYVTWTYTETDFKQLLGITDPEGVLRVSVSFIDRTVTVQLSRRA